MTDPAVPTPGCPRWLKILLGLSLAVNIAILGTIAGFFLRGGPPRDGPLAMGYAAPYVIALPRETRRVVLDTIRSDASLPSRGARKARYDEMLAALGADPFDRDRVQQILERQGDENTRVQEASRDAWLSAVADMDAAEREAYVSRIEDILRKGKRGRKSERD